MTVDVAHLLGAAAPWLVLPAVALFGVAGVLGFRQGREISIWPPRLGPAPVPAPRPEVSAAADEVPADLPTRPVREFGVDRSSEFYTAIATRYDQRNSRNLVRTHLATVAQLQELRDGRDRLRVLDLGGGTGKLIGVGVFNDPAIRWTYVDACPAMAAEFRQNLAGTRLGETAEVIVADMAHALRQFPSDSYDVILLSFVLSSMASLPSFAELARVLAPGGTLLVTDIKPAYTHAKPLYRVQVEEEEVALRTVPVDPFEIVHQATACGLHAGAQHTYGDGPTYYSFMTAFTKSPVPGAGPAPGGELVRAGR